MEPMIEILWKMLMLSMISSSNRNIILYKWLPSNYRNVSKILAW